LYTGKFNQLFIRGQTTKENLKTHKNLIRQGIIPYPRADLCGSEKPLLDFRAHVAEQKYKEMTSSKAELPVKIVYSPAGPKHKHHTESDQQIKLDASFLSRVKNANQQKPQERSDISSPNSEHNLKFTLKSVKKGT